MNFKIDENLPVEIVNDLRSLGHEAESTLEERMTGAADSVLLEAVKREGKVFLTMDKGIANVRSYPPAGYAGLILFRPRTSGKGAVLAFVRRHLPLVLKHGLKGRLFIVSERGIRVR